jgi:pyruvate dehydrogenase E1 component beta subunit
MREITYRQALNEALAEELERDPNVFLMGEEVAQYNGAYKVSQGLLDRFGPKRIIDTPISENGFAGMGIGAAMVGLRPIVEFMTFSFSLVAFDQVVNNAPNMLTMSGGQFNVPITFRGPNGPAHQIGATHMHATEPLYANFPGLKICTPATPRDAKGLLKTAIRDDNPVLVLEAELLYSSKGMIEPPEQELLIPLGQAARARRGRATRRGRDQRGSAGSALDQAARPARDLHFGREDSSRRRCGTRPAVLRDRCGDLLSHPEEHLR